MRIIGIDPGLSGGAFFYDSSTFEFRVYPFKSKDGRIDVISFMEWIHNMQPDTVFLEKIFLTGREGGRSAATIGSNYGRILATLEMSHVTYAEVQPKTWQRALSLKTGSRAIVKQSAQDLAVKRFTLLPFLQGKSKKPHDGLTDAACIALFGQIYLAERLWDDQKKTSIKSTDSFAFNTGTSAKKGPSSKGKRSKQSQSSKAKLKTSQPKRKARSSKSTQSSARLKAAGRNY